MVTTNPILIKIQKLLALSKSPNPNEAELALSKAHALLTEHNLTLADLPTDDPTSIESFRVNEFESEIRGSQTWIRVLAGVMAAMHHTRALRGHDNSYSFVGTEQNATACNIMFAWLHDLINDWARASAKAYPQTQRTHARNSYKIGMVRTIAQRVKELQAATNSANLPAVITTLEKNNEEFLNQKYSNLRPGRKLSLNVHHQDGYAQGREDGNNVNLQSNNLTSTTQPAGALT